MIKSSGGAGTGDATAPPIFHEIGEILAFSAPNISRSKEGAALKKSLAPPIFHTFRCPYSGGSGAPPLLLFSLFVSKLCFVTGGNKASNNVHTTPSFLCGHPYVTSPQFSIFLPLHPLPLPLAHYPSYAFKINSNEFTFKSPFFILTLRDVTYGCLLAV